MYKIPVNVHWPRENSFMGSNADQGVIILCTFPFLYKLIISTWHQSSKTETLSGLILEGRALFMASRICIGDLKNWAF
jgi:hypothetical protein